MRLLSPPGSARLEAGTLAYPQGAKQSIFPLCPARPRSLLKVHRDTQATPSPGQIRHKIPLPAISAPISQYQALGESHCTACRNRPVQSMRV